MRKIWSLHDTLSVCVGGSMGGNAGYLAWMAGVPLLGASLIASLVAVAGVYGYHAVR